MLDTTCINGACSQHGLVNITCSPSVLYLNLDLQFIISISCEPLVVHSKRGYTIQS